jgi:hypothetical protein
MSTTLLRDRGIVEVAGPDAANFLQGLITNDVARAKDGHAVYAALLTPQGKIIYDFLVAPAPNGFYLDCVRAHAADLAARLTKYRLRAKVTIADRSSEFVVLSLAAPTANAVHAAFQDPRLAQLGFRAVVPASSVVSGGDDQDYQTRRLALGIPDSAIDIPPETLFPLDCNFEELHGVDFDKGCYVGQELTARMKHRATARRRMLPVEADVALPPTGTPLKVGPTDIGELRGAIAKRGMALVRLDRLGSATEAAADNIIVRILRPAYPLILPAGEHT